MGDDFGFLQAIQADPADTTVKLAYADWLDERGERAKAEYLRLLTEVGGLKPPLSVRSREKTQRFRELDSRLRGSWHDLVHGHTRLWGSVTMLALGRLQGLLSVYAALSGHEADIWYEFAAQLTPRTSTIAEMAPSWYGDVYTPVAVEPLADWETDLRGILDEWLFSELRHLRNAHSRLAFLSDARREWLIPDILTRIREVITPDAGWRVQVTTNRFYALNWADVALESTDRVLWLHFSFSD